jgi:glycosyltransferase involved in cell wall biosynthesis
VSALGLGARVHFVGPRRPQELSLYLSAADVFVLASRLEGWANVLLEAMACGLPIVATDVGGNAEVVADDRLGLIVPFGAPQELAQALADALNTAWDRRAIRAYAESNAWEARIPDLLGVFDRVVAEWAGRSGRHAERTGAPGADRARLDGGNVTPRSAAGAGLDHAR